MFAFMFTSKAAAAMALILLLPAAFFFFLGGMVAVFRRSACTWTLKSYSTRLQSLRHEAVTMTSGHRFRYAGQPVNSFDLIICL